MTESPRGPRRVWQLASVVVAVIALTGGITLLPRLTGTSAVSGASPAVPPSESAAPSDPPSPTESAHPSEPARPTGPATVDSASRALAAAARQLLPDATFGSMPVAFDDGTRDLRPFEVVDNEHGYFIALAQITRDNGANGLFTLIMWPGADSWKAPTMDCDRPAGDGHVCETRTGPGGERTVIERGQWLGSDVTEFQVKLRRPDGTLLVAKANDDADGVGPSPAPRSAGPPLTTDQLLALLETPGLGVPTPRTRPG